MPPPGWYDDPGQPWTWRYWDGAYWTENRAPMWVPPGSDPMSLSVWFEQSVAAGKIAVRRVGAVLVALWLVLGAAGWWLVVASLDSARGRELRRLLEIDRTTGNPIGPSATADMTDAEVDRAWELTQDIFWSALPWLVLLTVAFIVASAWSIALVVQVVQSQPADSPGADQPAVGLGSVITGAIRRVPAVLGAGIVVVVAYTAALAVATMPVLVVALAGGGAAAIGLTAIFVVPLLLVVTVWLWGRLTLTSAIAAAGGHGIGVRRSWDITQERFWFVVGRLLVTAMIAGVAGAAVNAVTGFGQFLGFNVFLAIVLAAAGARLRGVHRRHGLRACRRHRPARRRRVGDRSSPHRQTGRRLRRGSPSRLRTGRGIDSGSRRRGRPVADVGRWRTVDRVSRRDDTSRLARVDADSFVAFAFAQICGPDGAALQPGDVPTSISAGRSTSPTRGATTTSSTASTTRRSGPNGSRSTASYRCATGPRISIGASSDRTERPSVDGPGRTGSSDGDGPA
jgi:hypothetical protein